MERTTYNRGDLLAQDNWQKALAILSKWLDCVNDWEDVAEIVGSKQVCRELMFRDAEWRTNPRDDEELWPASRHTAIGLVMSWWRERKGEQLASEAAEEAEERLASRLAKARLGLGANTHARWLLKKHYDMVE